MSICPPRLSMASTVTVRVEADATPALHSFAPALQQAFAAEGRPVTCRNCQARIEPCPGPPEDHQGGRCRGWAHRFPGDSRALAARIPCGGEGGYVAEPFIPERLR